LTTVGKAGKATRLNALPYQVHHLLLLASEFCLGQGRLASTQYTCTHLLLHQLISSSNIQAPIHQFLAALHDELRITEVLRRVACRDKIRGAQDGVDRVASATANGRPTNLLRWETHISHQVLPRSPEMSLCLTAALEGHTDREVRRRLTCLPERGIERF